tara:strand:- start:6778 stop:7089 length:312 start_codon:yes stop_codon:yes gene_type:complete
MQYDNSGTKEREVETSQEQNTWPNTQTARVRLSTCDGTTNTWIAEMTDRYNGTGVPSGCNGLSGNNTNSVCGRKAHFCPGNTPSKECKCEWLTNFTAQNNCNC